MVVRVAGGSIDLGLSRARHMAYLDEYYGPEILGQKSLSLVPKLIFFYFDPKNIF